MMNIVIIGAGTIGLHLARILSKLHHDVVVVDKDEAKLAEATKSLDIGVKQGSGTDIQLLEELSSTSSNRLLVAVTDSDETNLTTSTLAKYLNYPQTVARVNQSQFINCSRLDIERVFHVDYLISPDLLVAMELYTLVAYPGKAKIYNFAHGALQTRTLTIPLTWEKQHVPILNLCIPENIKVGLIRRGQTLIFPHGNDTMQAGDLVTFIGESAAIQNIHELFGLKQKKVKQVVIGGGSQVALHLANILEKEGISYKIIEKNSARCEFLSQKLKGTILCNDLHDPLFMREEGIMKADYFIAATKNDAENLLMGKIAREAGAKQVSICLSNPLFAGIADEFKMDYVSQYMATEAQILSIINSEKISSKVFLYEDEAEILEIRVTSSTMAGMRIADLASYLPKDFLFAAIKNRGRILIAGGQRILSPGDTVIAITHPKHTAMLEDLF